MSKTNWQDPQPGIVYSSHITGLQEAVGKLEDSVNLPIESSDNISLSEVFIHVNNRYRIYQAISGQRNWVANPAPVIRKNGTITNTGFEIDYGGGAIILSTPALSSDVFTVSATYTKKINLNEIVDKLNLPGSKTLIAGDKHMGLFGFVQASELITGSKLALDIGLSAGTLINDTTQWIKYMSKGDICYRPLRSIRHSNTWDQLYNAGAVYGTGDEGLLPPTGRLGINLSISATDNSINTTNQNFLGDKLVGMDYSDTVAKIGDKLILKGWTNVANNGEFTVVSITNTKIVVSGGVLVSEVGNKLSRFYEKTKAVVQNASVTINGIVGKVRLMRGAAKDPMDSYGNTDRGGRGRDNEYNWLIGQLHEHAKLKNWIYPQYMDVDLGDFGTYLTDKDLVLHNTFGTGSYQWMQETSDTTTWRRAVRGNHGASYLTANHSWTAGSNNGFAPVLAFTQAL